MDDNNEEIIFWKHFIGWLITRLEDGLLESQTESGLLLKYFYTFNQALTGTNASTVLLWMSVGFLTVLPLWRRWLCWLCSLFYCFDLTQCHMISFWICSVSAFEKKREMGWGVPCSILCASILYIFMIISTRFSSIVRLSSTTVWFFMQPKEGRTCQRLRSLLFKQSAATHTLRQHASLLIHSSSWYLPCQWK